MQSFIVKCSEVGSRVIEYLFVEARDHKHALEVFRSIYGEYFTVYAIY